MNLKLIVLTGCCCGSIFFPASPQAAIVSWVGGSGDWTTSANWSSGTVPGPIDDVVIGSGPAITVTISSGSNAVHSLVSQQAFVVSGYLTTLAVSTTLQVNNSFTLNEGILVGGTVLASTNGAPLVVGSLGGTLNGVTLDGNIDVGVSFNGVSLFLYNGLVLNGTVQVGNPTNGSSGRLLFFGSQTLSGSGTVLFGSNLVCNLMQIANSGTTLTIGPGITVGGINGLLGYGANCLGGPTDVGILNQGTISSVSGGTIGLFGYWTNQGRINLTNSTLTLGGSFTHNEVGLLNRSGGTIYLSGIVNNSTSTLALDALGGSWVMNAGTILGGTVTASNGTALLVKGNVVGGQGGLLDGVTMVGALDVGNYYSGAELTVTNGLTLNGVAVLGNLTNDHVGWFSFTGSQSLRGNGSVLLENYPGAKCQGLMVPNPGTTLTVGPGITVRGKFGTVGYTTCTFGPTNVFVINQGAISADTSGGDLLLECLGLTNLGLISANSTLSCSGDIWLDGAGTIQSPTGGVLQAGASLLGNTTNSSQFVPQGTLEFLSGVHQLEAMSEDLGKADTGYGSNNFAYGTISLDSGAQVTLVDESRNSAGSLPECVYVDQLILRAGASLNLNGLNLYTKLAQNGGSIIGGTLSQVPINAGTLRPDTTSSGSLSPPGALEAWTFFGRSGQVVVVAADPGSVKVPAPHLNNALLQLLDPTTNLLAQATNSLSGQVVALMNVHLPADGLYTVLVRAPGNQPASTGNYQITVWDVTQVTQASLLINQRANGQVSTPYSVDQWNFSAAAGQQISFDLINGSAPGVAFDLTGPNGWVGFSNLTTSSDLVTLPSSGAYTLSAFGTGGSYGTNFAFELVETAETNLALGATFTGQFVGNNQAELFAITVTNSGPLRIMMNGSGINNATELYVKLGSPPTRGIFDFEAVNPNTASQQILIPNAVPGTYYVLVYGNVIANPGNFTLQAVTAGVFLTSVTPNLGANNATLALTLNGARFLSSTTVQLVSSNGTSFPATSVEVDSYTQITSTFASNTLPAGTYSLRVTQTDGSSAELINGFTVTAAGAPAQLQTQLIMPAFLGRHVVATIYVQYSNTGGVAMPAPLLELMCTGPAPTVKPVFTLDQSRVVQDYWSSVLPPGTANQVFILASGAQAGVLNPGEQIQVPVYYLGLQQPWDFTQTSVQLQIRFWLANDPTPIDWSAEEASLQPTMLDSNNWDIVYRNLTSGLTNTGAYVQMLDNNAQYLSQLGERVTDIDSLWGLSVQQTYGFTPVPVLDSAVDASMPTPRVSLNLSRRFGPTLLARNSKGPLGYGWYTSWQARIVVQNNGDMVEILGEAGSVRVFTRDSRTGNYFSSAGDTSTLNALPNGIYQLQDPNGTVTQFRADGNFDFVQDINGNRITVAYNGSGQFISLSHSAGGSLSFAYNNAGLISSVTDSAGRSVAYSYDSSTSYLTSASTDDGKITGYTYNSTGPAPQLHALTSVTRGGTTRYFTYDENGRLASTYLASGQELLSLSYESPGIVSVNNGLGTSSYYYDYRGLVAKIADPLGNTATFQYDEQLRPIVITAPTGDSQSLTWCSCGGLASLTDEIGHTVAFQHNNPFLRLTGLTDAGGNSTSYSYDSLGNLQATTYADGSAETFGAYSAVGLPQTYVNRRHQTTSMSYSSAGQPTLQSFADGSSAAFEYDTRGNLLAATNHPTSGTNQVTTYSYNYASDGDRLRMVTYPNGRWIAYSYDTFGRRQTIAYSSGQTNQFDYDEAGRLSTVRDASNHVLVAYSYSSFGKVQRVDKGNNSYATFAYDGNGHLLSLVHYRPGGSTYSSLSYTYDARGRRTSLSSLDGEWTYQYDGAGQLTFASFLSSNPAVSNQNFQCAYDAAGNRTALVVNGVTRNYVANQLNQYTRVDGTAWQYDADGNPISDGLHSYAYDTQNRLISVSGPEGATQYEYDTQGNRTATVFNGQRTEHLVDPNGKVNVVAEFDATGNLLAENVFGLGLAGRSVSGTQYYYDFDGLGSVIGLTGSNGVPVNDYSYLPFGNVASAAASIPNPFQFGGRLGIQTEGSGLEYMRARYYSPADGRFLTIDPIRIAGGINLYEYAKNDPVAKTDPTGLDCIQDMDQTFGKPSFSCGLLIGCSAGVGYGVGLGLGLNFNGPGVGPSAGCGISFGCSYGTQAGLFFGTGNQCKGGGPGPGGGGAGGGGGGGGGGSAGSGDPNRLSGPAGYAIQNFIMDTGFFSYEIDFQNETNATAPAQIVQINNPLSTNLDWSTFQLGQIAFSDTFINVPRGAQYFETNLPMSYGGVSFQVQIQAGIDRAGGEIFASFFSIDPATSLPPAVNIGFLPPEDGTGRGSGQISYLIRPRPYLPAGTQITNVAFVRFDLSTIIATDQLNDNNPALGIDTNKLALVTIDDVPPVSSVTALPVVETTSNFTVCWSGTDFGSGIVAYDLYVSTNNGVWTTWLSGTTNLCATFAGQNGASYAFYSVARDGAGNIETKPPAAETSTKVQAGVRPQIISSVIGPGGVLTIRFTSLAGSTNVVQASSDLISWLPLQTLTNTAGVLQFQDLSATNYPQRFYRIQIP